MSPARPGRTTKPHHQKLRVSLQWGTSEQSDRKSWPALLRPKQTDTPEPSEVVSSPASTVFYAKPTLRKEEVAPSDSSQHAVGRQHSKIARGDPKALSEKLSAVGTAWGNSRPACG